MPTIVIAMDLGTSGIRAQAIDLSAGEIISTAVTTRHPLPGANVIDHLHFALEMGVEIAHQIITEAVNKVIGELNIQLDQIIRLAVCGNPIQLSLFQGIEIRDLAYAGKRKLQSLGVVPPQRDAAVMAAQDISGLHLPRGSQVLIPPAVRHEIGADALAMIIQTGLLAKEETSLATDYGTNAEMALYHNGRVITGSTAAGPALEGQGIGCGMLAVPGVISDLAADTVHHRVIVLNSEMRPAPGPLVNLSDGHIIDCGAIQPIGITGTGTIAIINQAVAAGLMATPYIHTADGKLHFGGGIWFSQDDLIEAGKAIGAVRAGHITLCQEAGIALEDVQTAYMAGASGTYVDAVKAQQLGLVPARVKQVYQVGNTSLAMARDLAIDPRNLDKMSQVADQLRETHCMFASSKTFEKAFILEFSHWTEGMPMSLYRKFLKKYGFPDLLPVAEPPEIIRVVERDIAAVGRLGLKIITDIGKSVQVSLEGCIACLECVEECPESAITFIEGVEPPALAVNQPLCNGMACRRCEQVCPEKVFELARFFSENSSRPQPSRRSLQVEKSASAFPLPGQAAIEEGR
jgi:methylamine methyltransferase corrinoid protein reductive activase